MAYMIYKQSCWNCDLEWHCALTEKVSDTTGTNPNKHLIKLGARCVVEWHICLARHGTGQQGLSCTRRPNQQDS